MQLPLVISLVLFAASQVAPGALPSYDGINYSAGYDLGAQSDTNTSATVLTWTHIGTTVAGQTTTINVGSANLIYSGLANSTGNSVTNPAGPSQGLRYHSHNANLYSSGIFYSALFKLNSLGTLGTGGDYILALNNTSTTNQTSNPTTIPARTYVRKSPSDSAKYNVGLAYTNGGAPTIVWDSSSSSNRSMGDTILVVVKYVSGTGASMWVNPDPSTLGAGSPPSGNIDNNTANNTPGATIQSLLVVNQTATSPRYAVDEVRLGLTWASVTPAGPPQFSVQPSNAIQDYGGTATFSAAAVGLGPITYAWKTNGVTVSDGPTGTGSVISGSTTATLTNTGVSQSDEMNYKVTATDGNGSTDSATVTLTVNDPKLTSQPVASNPAPLPGATVSFTNAAAIGTPTLNYRWQRNGVNVDNGTFGGAIISGANTASLTIQGVRAGGGGDGGSYVLWVTNGLGRTTSSSPVAMTVSDPVIVSSPTNTTRNFNDSVTFTATISGSAPPFTYQWKKDGANINDGDLGGRAHVSPAAANATTTTTLTIDNLISTDAASSPGYSVVVTDNSSSSASSAAATLTLNDPYLVTPVANVSTNAGATAVMKVQVAGSGTLTFVWKTNGIAVADGATPWGSTISGSGSDTLLITSVTLTDAKTYSVEVSGAGPTVTSAGSLSVAQITRQPGPASLTVVVSNRTVFSAAAVWAGPGALTYQWVHNNGTPYAGQTAATFRIDSTQTSDADASLKLKVFYTANDFILSSPVALAVSTDPRLRAANLVVLRAGDGSQALTNGAQFPASIYFDQFDPSGNFVSTTSVPDSGTDAAVTYNNDATSSGLNTTSLQRSADGRRLVFSAFNANLAFGANLTAANSTTAPRCAGLLGPFGEYSLFKDTALFSGNNYRTALHDGTNDFWGGGTTASTSNAVNGIFYAGSATPSTTAISTAAGAGAGNVRCAHFVNVNGTNRLYFDAANTPAGLYYIDGFPKTGSSTVVTNLVFSANGAGTGAPGATDFAVSPDGNTIYVADGRGWSATVANTTGGIQKWTNGVLDKVLRPDPSTSVGTMYVAADFSANPVVLYAITTAFGANLDQNELVKVTDDGSANGVATVLAPAAANECFRGISFGPTVLPPNIDTISQLPDRNFRLTVSGSSNVSYYLQSSSTLSPPSWSSLVTNNNPNGSFQYDDLTATNFAQRFYRAGYTP
jgi:hypothetical protein